MIRIRSRKEGFRRCGVVHSADWVEYPVDRFSVEEIERLRAEPMLQVEVVDDKDRKKSKSKE